MPPKKPPPRGPPKGKKPPPRGPPKGKKPPPKGPPKNKKIPPKPKEQTAEEQRLAKEFDENGEKNTAVLTENVAASTTAAAEDVAKRKEGEAKKAEEEAKRKEAEAKKAEEEATRKEEAAKKVVADQANAEKVEEESKRKVAGTDVNKVKEEATRKEETEKRVATDKAKVEEEAKRKQEEATRKQEEVTRKQEEAKRAAAEAGLPADADAATEKENQAAAKLQATHRGNAARKETKDQNQAATKLQAMHRGNQERKDTQQNTDSSIKNEGDKEDSEGSGGSGDSGDSGDNGTNVQMPEPTNENNAAAITIQSAQRVKQAKDDKERMLKEDLTPAELEEIKEMERLIAEREKMQGKKTDQERRIDDNDGKQYTQQQFYNKYNSLKEWNKSLTQAQMLGQTEAPAAVVDRRSKQKKKAISATLEQKSQMMQIATGIELKAIPFTQPKGLQDAQKMIDRYRERELDLLEFQALQAEKMSGLRRKAEKTVGSLSQEIEMMSSDIADMRMSVNQEIKERKKEERNRRTAEADAERLRRELRGEREELRVAIAKETELQIERDRLDAVLGKVGANALDDLEARLEASEERRWQADAEIEKLRAELNWQTNGRMDERTVVSQLNDDLSKEIQAKRRVEVKKTQLEETLETSMAQLRARKRESTDFRKRIDTLLQKSSMSGGTGVGRSSNSRVPRRSGYNHNNNSPSLPPRPKIEDPVKPSRSKRSSGRNGVRVSQELGGLRRKIAATKQRVGFIDPAAPLMSSKSKKKKGGRRGRDRDGGGRFDEPHRGRFGI